MLTKTSKIKSSKLPSPTVKLPSPTVKLPSPTVKLPSPTVKLPSPTIKLPSPTIKLLSPIVKLRSPIVKLRSPIVKLRSPTLKSVKLLSKQQSTPVKLLSKQVALLQTPVKLLSKQVALLTKSAKLPVKSSNQIVPKVSSKLPKLKSHTLPKLSHEIPKVPLETQLAIAKSFELLPKTYSCELPSDFNWIAYRSLNSDLKHICSRQDAVKHYMGHGYYQDRQYNFSSEQNNTYVNQSALRTPTSQTKDKLPEHFDWVAYRSLNSDLKHICSHNDAVKHYINHGNYQNRPYVFTVNSNNRTLPNMNFPL